MDRLLLHILRHSLGVDDAGRGTMYRNRFVTDPDSDDGALCRQLVSADLMIDRGAVAVFGGMHCYQVTDAGKAVVIAHPPQKVSRAKQRYDDFLAADTGESFGEWLKRRSRARRAREVFANA